HWESPLPCPSPLLRSGEREIFPARLWCYCQDAPLTGTHRLLRLSRNCAVALERETGSSIPTPLPSVLEATEQRNDKVNTHDKGGVNTVFQRWVDALWTLDKEAPRITFQAPKRRSRDDLHTSMVLGHGGHNIPPFPWRVCGPGRDSVTVAKRPA